MAIASKKTQEFVPIQEIRDGVVIMKDASMRMVLIASSINFALKSGDEQMAIITEYANFMNSLDFQIQVSVQSRKLDIKPYLMTLEERLKEETNELIKIQITEYIQFIKSFTDATNIMNKSFFIVVPYSPPVFDQKKGGLLGGLLGGKKKNKEEQLNTFIENKSQLEQRASVVEQGLSGIGVRVVPLGTEELVELYFKIFNPGETEVPVLGE